MDVHLTPEAEQIVSRYLASGRFRSSDEMMAEAVRLLDLREHAKDEMREQIEAGWQSIQAGRVSDGEAFMKALLADLDDGAA